ncbi:MAG: transporter [Candidatus Brocadiia bacterium]
MRRGFLAVLVICCVFLSFHARPLSADEIPADARSWSSAVLGAEGLYAGALPAPGWHAINYVEYYQTHKLKGRKGREVDMPPDYEASVWAECLRAVYVADTKFLGATPAWHAIVPVVNRRDSTDIIRDNESGLGDIYVSPLILGWHNPPWHYVLGLDVIMPTGEYYPDDFVTIGHNHWTFEPAFAFSYIGKNGFTGSAKIMYDYHTEDNDIDYEEGQQIHIDYHAGYSFGENRAWTAGLTGYYLRSLEEDTFNSNSVDSSEEEVLAVGPSIAYKWEDYLFELKIQQEIRAKNRPKGTAAWLKFTYSF